MKWPWLLTHCLGHSQHESAWALLNLHSCCPHLWGSWGSDYCRAAVCFAR